MQSVKNIILSLIFLSFTAGYCCASVDDDLLSPKKEIEILNQKTNRQTNYFNLANIVDSFWNNEVKTETIDSDKKSKLRKDFIAITSKFNQGNALVAYDEYDKLIEETDSDTLLLILSKIFYEIGYFSLANKATDKIIYKNQFYDNIADLENSYKTHVVLSKEDEVYFAKLYSQIYFDNSALEAASELMKKFAKEKNDFASFYLARAYLEAKNYSQALNSINKAISINPHNINYQIFKIDILQANKKYKDAENLLLKLKKQKNIISFSDKIKIKEQEVLFNLNKNEKEKKYHTVKEAYIEGNYEKVKKDCISILNFDKDNDKIMTLYAKSELASGNTERANSFFVNSYKIQKNNIETIIGLGDIRYIHGDYKNSVKMYKKAYSKDKSNYETIIKLSNAQRHYAKYPKELKKLEMLIDKMPKGEFGAYYESAISIAQRNSVLKEDYLKRALSINPLHKKTMGELMELYLKNKNYELAKGLIYSASFTLEKNYYYYYLCGLYNQAMNKNKEAIRFYKKSLNLNPNFEIANVKLLKLIPDNFDEEI